MTHPQSHHGQPPTTIQVGKKHAKQAGKVRIPKRTLRKSKSVHEFRPCVYIKTVIPLTLSSMLSAHIRFEFVE
jgi:hypothetical protein